MPESFREQFSSERSTGEAESPASLDTEGTGLAARSLQTSLCDDAARIDGIDEGLVVAFVLIGVGGAEVGDGPIEDVAVAQIGGNSDAVA